MIRRIYGRLMFLAAVLLFPGAALAGAPSDDFDCKNVEQVRNAVAHKDADAAMRLAKLYNKGQCVPQDLKHGAELIALSAALGSSFAQNILAISFDKEGQDDKALIFARRSAEQGDPDGQHLLAYLYVNGKGIVNDDDEAAKWARRSAEQGNEGGQTLLARLYSEGRGVPQDYIEADKWLMLANKAEGEDASVGVIGVQKAWELMMSKADVVEAHKRVEAWKPKPEPKQR